jgi:hypothetical protein
LGILQTPLGVYNEKPSPYFGEGFLFHGGFSPPAAAGAFAED